MADPFDIRFRTAHHRNRWAYHGAWYAENNPDFIKLSKDDVLVGGLIAELRKSGLMAELLVAFPDTRDFGDNLKFLIHEYLKHGGDLGIVDYFRMCLNAMRKYDIEAMLRKNGITPSKGTFKACDVQNALKVACNGKEVGIECVKGEDGQYYLYQVAIGVDDELNLVDSDMKKIMGGCKSDDPIIYESYDINGYELGKINQEKPMSRRRDYGAGSRCCRVCGNHHGVIQKYGLMCCRRCFRSNAKHMGFIKYR